MKIEDRCLDGALSDQGKAELGEEVGCMNESLKGRMTEEIQSTSSRG